MSGGMLAPPIAGGVMERRWRNSSAEWPVVADISRDVALDRLTLGQDRHVGVIAMQPLGGEHGALDLRKERLKRDRTGADLVGKRRHAQIATFPPVALALTVQRPALPEPPEQDHGQQVGAAKAAPRHAEGCRRLRDRLAVPARERLAHRLDYLPLARDHLQRLGDVLAKLRQLR